MEKEKQIIEIVEDAKQDIKALKFVIEKFDKKKLDALKSVGARNESALLEEQLNYRKEILDNFEHQFNKIIRVLS